MNEHMDRITVITQCVFLATENNVGYPIYSQIFEYEKRNGDIEYGFLIKHRDFVSQDYIHDDIILTYSDKLVDTYAQLLRSLYDDYGVDSDVASRYLKAGCR